MIRIQNIDEPTPYLQKALIHASPWFW